ncbi:MAG TPA: Gfo/Idh/MocA family oxidoreductase [Bryobacteraceae bacterium]|nr:Gfo/Idh/MocA family oxidoreductase [Bryobacteraceae bacterium]
MERRQFLRGGLAAAASAQVARSSDPVRLGIIGLGTRGAYELEICLRTKDAKVVAVADVYQALVDKYVAASNGSIAGYQDFRQILDRKDIDAVFVSVPDHWHAPATILACQAGKDVFCEKPLSHTIHEGQMMVAAARRYNRVVQTGSQQRSAPHFQKIVGLVQQGHIGKVTAIECWNEENDTPEGAGSPPDSDPPAGLDWNMYLGPAPKVPYNRSRYIWHYRWFWDYSGGMMTDWGAHHMDIIQWAMQVDGPLAASAVGGRYCLKDNCETPDTLMTVFEYPDFAVRYSVRMGNSRRLEGRPNGVAFYGTDGTLIVDRGSWEVVPENAARFPNDYDRVEAWVKGGNVAFPFEYDRTARVASKPRCQAMQETGLKIDPSCQEAHVQNFLDCVRSRERPIADVEIGYRSITACHVGTIAYRLGRKVRWDARAQTFPGDAEAQAMMTKRYRQPWTLPAV